MKKLLLVLSLLLTNLIYSQQASKVNNAQNVNTSVANPLNLLGCEPFPLGTFKPYFKDDIRWETYNILNLSNYIGTVGAGLFRPITYVPTSSEIVASLGYTPYNGATNPAGFLTSSDVSGTYVPIIRTVNGHALSSNISLSKSDIGLSNADNTSDINKPVSSATQTALDAKQSTLVSGTNIKTIETQTILGAGNIDLNKSDVGLGNVDNTSDLNKPVSTATQTALDLKQVSLVSGTNIKTLEGQSLLGTGNIDLTKNEVGLSNVDNTSDINKPISTATQSALDTKLSSQTQVDWNQSNPVAVDFIKNKPSIPGAISLTTTGTGAATLISNVLNIPTPSIPTNNNQLTNGNNYVDAAGARGSISLSTTGTTGTASYSSSTGILNIPSYAPTNSQIISALGFTPYSSSNPSGYVNQAGARTSISLTTSGTSGVSTYDNSTGVLNIPNYNVSAPSFNNTAVKTINGAGVQISTTKNTRVSYTITHTIALTLILSSGSSMVYLEISPNNSTWTSISQAGFSDAVAVAVALNKTSTNNVQGEIPAGFYVRLRAVTSGAGSAAYTVGQEVQY